jgi:hypothetical protein
MAPALLLRCSLAGSTSYFLPSKVKEGKSLRRFRNTTPLLARIEQRSQAEVYKLASASKPTGSANAARKTPNSAAWRQKRQSAGLFTAGNRRSNFRKLPYFAHFLNGSLIGFVKGSDTVIQAAKPNIVRPIRHILLV